MTPKEWTLKDLNLLLKEKFAESGISVKWRTKRKGKQRTTTIGAIFVPRPPTQEETNAYPIEEVKHDA